MIKNNQCICIIPARGGSKSIPQKNLISFSGKPLIAWTIIQAKLSKYIDRLIVSSDSPEIISVAGEYGAETVLRPEELASDEASSESAIKHAISSFNLNPNDLIVFLQATSPLRGINDIDLSIKHLLESNADSLFSMSSIDDFTAWVKQDNGNLAGLNFDPKNRGRRQDRKNTYLENGSIYLFYKHVLDKHNNRFGKNIEMYPMSLWKSYEIDNPEDLEITEFFFQKYLFNKYLNSTRVNRINKTDLDLIVYDFDGVMTDNKCYLNQNGEESVCVNRGDGLGIYMIKKLGIPQVILSTEENKVVSKRGKKLDIPVFQGVLNKADTLSNYCNKNNFSLDRTLFIGNDLNDKDAMILVSFPVCPSDAHIEIQALSKIVFPQRGGDGVIRELANRIY